MAVEVLFPNKVDFNNETHPTHMNNPPVNPGNYRENSENVLSNSDAEISSNSDVDKRYSSVQGWGNIGNKNIVYKL